MAIGTSEGSVDSDNESTSPSTKGPNANGGPKFPRKTGEILHPDLVIRSKDETPAPETLGLQEELPGWHGYVEWEQYPERKEKVKEFMKKFDFPGVSCHISFPSNIYNRNSADDEISAPGVPTCTAPKNKSNPRGCEMETISLRSRQGYQRYAGGELVVCRERKES